MLSVRQDSDTYKTSVRQGSDIYITGAKYDSHIYKTGARQDSDIYKTGARQDSDIKKQASDMDISRKLNVKNDLDEYGVCVLSLIHISEPTRPVVISYAVFCL